MYNIEELKDRLLSELKEIAEELGVTNFNKLSKQDLIYKILDQQAITPPEKLPKKYRTPARKSSAASPAENESVATAVQGSIFEENAPATLVAAPEVEVVVPETELADTQSRPVVRREPRTTNAENRQPREPRTRVPQESRKPRENQNRETPEAPRSPPAGAGDNPTGAPRSRAPGKPASSSSTRSSSGSTNSASTGARKR